MPQKGKKCCLVADSQQADRRPCQRMPFLQWVECYSEPMFPSHVTRASIPKSRNRCIWMERTKIRPRGRLLPVTVLSRIYRLGEKFRVGGGHKLLRGVRGHAPPEIFWNEYALRCNLVHFETQFWEILQWYFILFFSKSHKRTERDSPSHAFGIS